MNVVLGLRQRVGLTQELLAELSGVRRSTISRYENGHASPTLEMLQRFTEDLTALQRAIRWGEGETLETLFRRTREVRQSVIDAHQAGTFDAREPEQAGITPPDPDKTDHPGE